MTERGEAALAQTRMRLNIGPSALEWDGKTLTITIDEWAVPLPRPVSGTLRLTPRGITKRDWPLDFTGKHWWRPIAPLCDVVCEMEAPNLRWTGEGYIDSNWGSEMLEEGFSRWNWSRASLGHGAGILYDAHTLDGGHRQYALEFDEDGEVDQRPIPRPQNLPRCPIWRMPRETLARDQPRVLSTLEDTPFYSRSKIATDWMGTPVEAVHESLDLRKFSSPVVRAMLPFRMPRRAG